MLWGHTTDKVKYVDFPHINSVLGNGLTANAARFGSGAYGLRMFWTNLQAAQHSAPSPLQVEAPLWALGR